MAAQSPWDILSAAPAPSYRPASSVNSSDAMRVTEWSQCALAAGWEPLGSSKAFNSPLRYAEEAFPALSRYNGEFPLLLASVVEFVFEGIVLMATTTSVPKTRISGGSFLLETRNPEEVFTPEDFNEQQQ